MASDSSELKKRFDAFHREARFNEKAYRLLGKPQITDRLVSALFSYPEDVGDKNAFIEGVVSTLKTYGLDAAEPARQKNGVRIQARLLAIESEEASKAG
ncbi:MAG: hypothetical protein LCI00_10120 [Chloroflexi bacterium]|nr:hypothetical protein [Chloroflexota bacterium]MCC6892918.1 hypothetical protein [Anaerolineae bacterium]